MKKKLLIGATLLMTMAVVVRRVTKKEQTRGYWDAGPELNITID